MKQRIVLILAGTLTGMNLMLFSLIIGARSVAIHESVPSLAGADRTAVRSELELERVDTRRVPAQQNGTEPKAGFWTVERYREYEFRYDDAGRLMSKLPTGKETVLRYWNEAENGH